MTWELLLAGALIGAGLSAHTGYWWLRATRAEARLGYLEANMRRAAREAHERNVEEAKANAQRWGDQP